MPCLTIITNTDSSLPAALVDRYQIPLIPITIHVGEHSYKAICEIYKWYRIFGIRYNKPCPALTRSSW